ncbi:hypothetical protein MUP37_03310 [Candidatus Bathyarchaeota archaeon]|nr:hypothetical protein [Candidatus Bathyarchaeota archaeon]
MQEQTGQSRTSEILGNLPTIIGLIGMAVIAALYFMNPLWPPGAALRNATTLALPWPVIVVSLLLIRKNVKNLMSGGSGMMYSIILLAGAIGMVILYFVNGINDATLSGLYSNITIVGEMAVTSAIAISVFSPIIRVYRAKTWTMAFLIGLSILAFMTYTPIGQMLWPPIPVLGDWIQNYISGASDSAFWCSTYVGAVALIVRMTLLKEKLRP